MLDVVSVSSAIGFTSPIIESLVLILELEASINLSSFSGVELTVD